MASSVPAPLGHLTLWAGFLFASVTCITCYSLSALREVLQVTHSIYIRSLFIFSFFMGEVEIFF
ncbi:hypothetical protein BDD12DRAFT_853306 [Trichophaea hybrida]|nr:hypothetical protein BDD12DRAFT_853306 [Trichophaea hybrida]